MRPKVELAKIRRYSARLSRILFLLFNKLLTKREKNCGRAALYKILDECWQPYVYRRISVMYG